MKIRFQPPAPPYPPLAKMAGIQGTVVVELIIDPTGAPNSARAIAGPPQLRPTAEAYAMQWKFEPAMLNGKPQFARFKLTMPFRLRGGTKVKIQRTVLEIDTMDPSLKALVPALSIEAEETFKRLGVILVKDASGLPESTHHMLIRITKPTYTGGGLGLSLRCCLLQDVQIAATNKLFPKVIRTWQRDILPPPDPLASLKAMLREAIIESVDASTGVSSVSNIPKT